jgi:hypothetical protein
VSDTSLKEIAPFARSMPTVPRSSSAGWSITPKTLSHDASPRWMCSFTPVRRFSGCSSMPVAAMNSTKLPTSVAPAKACVAAT